MHKLQNIVGANAEYWSYDIKRCPGLTRTRLQVRRRLAEERVL